MVHTQVLKKQFPNQTFFSGRHNHTSTLLNESIQDKKNKAVIMFPYCPNTVNIINKFFIVRNEFSG